MDAVFTLISKKSVSEVLESLCGFSGIPFVLTDENGRELLRYGGIISGCIGCRDSVRCMEAHKKGRKYAYMLGETYIFSCSENCTHMAYPLTAAGELVGCVFAGPFSMDETDCLPETEDNISENEAYIEPGRVNNLKKIMDYTLSSLLPKEHALLKEKQTSMYQQSKINETIQQYKGIESTQELKFMYEKEKELLSKVREGDVQSAKALINELIGFALFSDGGAIEAVRPRAVELASLISRVAMDGGADPDKIYDLSSKYITRLYAEENFEELCMVLQSVVEDFMDAAFYDKDRGNIYIRRALKFVSENYGKKVSTAEAADYAGLSKGYFASLFSQITGANFKDHLNSVRIEESKRLLTSTDYDIADIAIAVGFPDQSYYSKVFKKITGITPGKYRTSMQQG